MRDRRALVAIGALCVLGFVGWRHCQTASPPPRREPHEPTARELIAAVERCLVGGTGVPGSEGALRLRRRRGLTSSKCATIAHGAGASLDVRGVYPELATMAEAIGKELDALDGGRAPIAGYPELARFLDAALTLNLPATSDAHDVRPLLDEGLPALGAKLAKTRRLAASTRPFEASLPPWKVIPGPPGALATLAPSEAPSVLPFSLYESGRNIYLNDDARSISREVFPGRAVQSFASKALVLTDSELLAYDGPRASSYAPAKTRLKAVSNEAFIGESCVDRRGAVAAIVDKDGVQLVRVEGASAELGPVLARPSADHVSSPGVTCTNAATLVAWVDSSQAHVATCTDDVCAVEHHDLPDLGAEWMTLGGFNLSEPSAHALSTGEVVLVWSDGAAVRFRIAPLARIGDAPTSDLFELGSDERAFTSSKPRFLAYDDAALAFFEGPSSPAGRPALLVRFDRAGARSMSP